MFCVDFMLQGDHHSHRNFQRMMGLEVTGQMNSETTEMMMAPRCGMPDVVPGGDASESLPGQPRDLSRPADFHAPGVCISRSSGHTTQ